MRQGDMNETKPQIVVEKLDMGYGSFILMRNLNFSVNRGDIFIIMGGSGCGKSTLLKILIGLKEPIAGKVFYGDTNYWDSDPDILFFDEPSAGLDPVSARLLDDLILELKDSLGTTFVVVTHELASIFAIGNNSVYLDVDSKTMTGLQQYDRATKPGYSRGC
jgi:ABC-type transporter Mla maintaining outer membrane lipid asymmetry ATPase subunit MlaF